MKLTSKNLLLILFVLTALFDGCGCRKLPSSEKASYDLLPGEEEEKKVYLEDKERVQLRMYIRSLA